MIWTQEHLNTLAAAVSQGIQTVKYDGREVTYQSLAEMRSLLAEMRAQVSPSTSGFGTVFTTFARD